MFLMMIFQWQYFFHDLTTKQHIEAYFSVLRRSQLSHPTIFSQNYNLIDPTFFTTLQHMWKKLPNDEDGTISQKAYDPLTFQWEDIYLGHVRGERPEGSRPWWEIDNLLMPVNVDGYHWVLAAVNLVERKVRIYDSLCIRLFGSNMSPH
ncbi:hypothetical protein ACOSQ2_024618 [Xanthoceras sorbifolium]